MLDDLRLAQPRWLKSAAGGHFVGDVHCLMRTAVQSPQGKQRLDEGKAHCIVHSHLDHGVGQFVEYGIECDCKDSVHPG